MIKLEKLTLKHLLARTAKLRPERPALAWVGETPITYGEMFQQVTELSQLLHNQGIVIGDRVAILSENMPNWGITYFAITTMGAIVVPILPDFRANEIHHILRHAECKAIFVSRKLYDRLEDMQVESIANIFLIDDFSIIPLQTKKDRLKEVMKEGRREFAKLREAALKMAGWLPEEPGEDDVAAIIYTSGTTGHSKGVMLTHKNLTFNAVDTMEIQTIVETDRLLSVLPLSHTYECTLGLIIPALTGASVYYLDKPPTARVLLPAMQEVKPTVMLTVPLIIDKVFRMKIVPTFTRSSLLRRLYKIGAMRKKLHAVAGKKLYKSFGGALHFFGIGGALLAPDVEQFLRDAKFPYAIGYGLTETSPLVAGCTPKITRYRSTGPVLPDLEVKINNPNPKTGEGEIWVRGDSVMKGYYKDPERTAEVITPDGWFKTGDLGVFDADGYLYIKGRSKNMILGPSGENIYPEEIESVINEHGNVLESLVYGQEGKLVARIHLNYEEIDRQFGPDKLSESQSTRQIQDMLEEIRQNVNNRVPAFSRISRVIEQTEPFEKTPTQKVKRFLYTS